jgi:translocator protein
MDRPLLYALGLCGVSVVLEGVFAGEGFKRRLAELRVPDFTPPFWGWIVIGLCYYVICFIVFYRLFSLPATETLRPLALAVLGGLMLINAGWNYFFFRTRHLLHAFLVGLPYVVLAMILFGVLLRVDRVAAWFFLPYLLYLVYASRFGYLVWKLNAPRAT